jgi:stearoyl-CoA desaturase (Delta-9 desaturase)
MTGSPDPNETTELPVADLDFESPAPHEDPGRISLTVRLAVLVAIMAPLFGVVAAPFMVWGWGFRWTDLGLLLILYVLTALGITVGYHRLFVHRSFETNIVVKFIFAVLGSMAVQGPLLMWAAKHRRHHQHADTIGDPHSPHGHAEGVLGVLRGLWHAHIGGCSIPTRRTWNATSRT